VLRDAIGRDWQCGTTQVDFNLPERFGAFYVDADGSKKPPVMIHRAICGSMERFLGILIENFAGHLPLWLAPTRWSWRPSPRTPTTTPSGWSSVARRGPAGEADVRNEKINYKVREHSLAKVPVMLVVGKREAEEGTVNDPPPRLARPAVDDAGGGDGRPHRRGDGAGREAAKGGRLEWCAFSQLCPTRPLKDRLSEV
jgi:threonyl-tRNA synthetase